MAGRSDSGYRAFISYSHADRQVVDWLHGALEGYRVPAKLVGEQTALGPVPARLGKFFRDRDELPAAGDLSAELKAALKKSMFLIVVCSPAAAQSKWVNEEVRQFKLLHGHKRGDGTARVLALIADGDPGDAGGGACFPPALKFHVLPDGSISDDPAEPIAADVRPGGDGKKLALMKLVAGLTGLPLDALVQREAARRQRRAALVSGASLVLTGVMAVLTVLAVQGRREAERQRAQADGLIEYMLTDLRKKLEPVGRLEVMDSVGQRALAYYAAQELGRLDPDALGRRARALHLVGEVRDLRGDGEGALTAFREAERTTAELLARDPRNPDRMFDHAQSVFWVGYMAWQQADRATAEDRFRRYEDLATALVASDPGQARWLTEQASAKTNLAIFLEEDGKSDEAIALFRSAHAISETLVARAPDDQDALKLLGQTKAWLSDALGDRGMIREAAALRQDELALYAGMLAVDQTRADAMQAMAVTQLQLAGLALMAGNVDESVARSDIALGLATKEVERDRENVLALDTLAGALNGRAEALLAAGRLDAAQEMHGLALQTATEIVDKNVESRFARYGREMQARWMGIALAFRTGDTARARADIARFAHRFPDSAQYMDRETVRWALSAVAAMSWMDCDRSDDACRRRWSAQLAQLGERSSTPREIALRRYLARIAPEEFPLPEKFAPSPADEVRYPVGAILDHERN